MSTIFTQGRFSAEDAAGAPLAGGLLHTYSSGTTTPKTTYSDPGLMAANTNPVALNARGEAQVWLGSGAYSMRLTDAAGVTIWTVDGVTPSSSSADALAAALQVDANGSGADLVAGAIRTVSTIAALRAVSSTGRNRVMVVGYYAPGDGGGGLYWLDTSDTTTADNGGTVIVSSAGGRWKLATQHAVTPRNFGARLDGVTDDAAAINACANAVRASTARTITWPDRGTALVGSPLNFSGISVIGDGGDKIHIKATSAQINVITTTGDTRLVGIYIDGGWDGSTSGQSGDAIYINATSPAYPYNVHILQCKIQNAKRCGIYFGRGGYSSVWGTKVNACGLHGIALYGVSGIDATTTVVIGGSSTFSDCPYGYGAQLNNCISVGFDGVTMEHMQGIQITGSDNRAIVLNRVHQENVAGLGRFLDASSASGIGLTISNCFGAGYAVAQLPNWENVHQFGNSALIEAATPLGGRVVVQDGGQQTTAVAGSFTAVTLSLPPGTWQLFGIVQTVNASAGTLSQLGCYITTSAAESGLQNATSGLFFGADQQTYNPGANADLRCSATDIVQNTTGGNMSVYLRVYVGRTAGTVAYRGAIKAVKI